VRLIIVFSGKVNRIRAGTSGNAACPRSFLAIPAPAAVHPNAAFDLPSTIPLFDARAEISLPCSLLSQHLAGGGGNCAELRTVADT
jgi:hypothetical protein